MTTWTRILASAWVSLWLAVTAYAQEQAQMHKADRDVEVLIVVGASGTDGYGQIFDAQISTWTEACRKAGIQWNVIGREAEENDAEKFEAALNEAALKPEGQFWLVMIGHGTFDGREAKFNLRGPDVTAQQVGEWLKPMNRELILIQSASASGGFLQGLNGKGRVLVMATKSADEIFYTRFGEYFAPAIAGLGEADLDHDKQVSVLEAFLYASKKTAEFYENEGRLATEHAVLEDNGDGISTRAEVFEGVRANDPNADGNRAAQIALILSEEEQRLTESQRRKRDALERELDQLKKRRADFSEDRYYADLEKLLRALAEVYR